MATKLFKPSKTAIVSINTPCLKFIQANRISPNKKHVAHIKAAMLAGTFMPPVTIDSKTKLIVDGQHRYLAACEIWKNNIEYSLDVILGEFSDPLKSAIDYNNNSRRWMLTDYVNAYCQMGNQSYILLKKFVSSHSDISYTTAVQLLTGKKFTKPSLGTLNISQSNIDIAENLYKELAQMASVTGDPRILNRNIVLSWIAVRDFILSKFKDLNGWLNALKKQYKAPVLNKQQVFAQTYLSIK